MTHATQNTLRRRLLQLAGSALLLLTLSPFAQAANPQVEIATNMGNITLELNADKAPQTVANFLKYVEDKHYEGTIFHRVIKGFMIQGGGMTADMRQKSMRAPIQNEAKNGLKNDRGTIAMARTSDPHSATAQFFINTVDNGFLDYPGQDGWGYCVFGKVTAGMDVVDKIRAVPTGMGDVPNTAIIIKSVQLLSAAKK
ncbi:peptidylprolyl isomerase [Uliginosibacterium flavum]|uniref:Peptidyl-prolyl cis-trans isomerase n=1 Tax=Uliginosibacterium flavum TaxID=1396831 RepID=A0ABV2TKW8_9RHOO